ncbi:pilus assembly PilX N-terminal domain-containing protein [Dethiobacter alkaliphilus]|uniref:pilus assembly PilX N-terminal domain-containing protein n=1 Tax=Dethiobacter alkaliphilus TaxID=427926 RepID=UPI002227B819|nr:pilus assembly PilX N-terminal domain-containing protein [Dethiobacter alkaliphilus]MCW3490304.1 pilus assembly PilX N-terminal domain-containing protein [Dethiobacter alkaliphilus]
MWKNDRGSALPVALLVMFVLTLLGTALWQYFINDTLQVARAENQVQAYYLGRSGVEVGLGLVETVLNDSSLNIHNISDLADELEDVNTVNAINTGTFDIRFSADTETEEVTVRSTGTAQGVSQNEAAVISMHFPNLGNPPYWVNSGYIVNSVADPDNPPGGYNTPSDQTGNVVFVSTDSNVGHPIQQSGQIAVFKASFMSFIDAQPSLQVQNNAELRLNAGVVSFRDQVYIGNNNAYLYLRTLPESANHSFEVLDSSFSDGYYYHNIRFQFGTYDFQINGLRTAEPLSGSQVGIVYFGGDLRKGSGNNPSVYLSVGPDGKYYFYTNDTAVHDFVSEIASNKAVEILNPHLLEELMLVGEGLPSINSIIWGER